MDEKAAGGADNKLNTQNLAEKAQETEALIADYNELCRNPEGALCCKDDGQR